MNSRQRRRLRTRYHDAVQQVWVAARMGLEPYVTICCHARVAIDATPSNLTYLRIAQQIHLRAQRGTWPPQGDEA